MKAGRVTSSFDAHITANIGFIAGLLGNIAQVKLSAGFSVYPNLYSYIIGESGQGKSGYLTPGLKLISKIQIEKDALYKNEKERREKLKKEQDQENKKRKVNEEILVFNQDLKNDYPDGIFNTKYPLFTGDFTIEGLQELAAVTTGGNCFAVRDEFAGTFNTFKKPGRQNDVPFLNEAYEASGVYSITRKMKEAKIPPIYNLCCSLLGGIQKTAIYRILDDYEKKGDGDALHARFQNLSILELYEEYQEAEAINPAYIKAFEDVVRQIIDERVIFSKIKPEAHAPHIFRLSHEAEALYKNFSRDTIVSTGNTLFNEFIRKTPTFLLKIALIFHILKKQNHIFVGMEQDFISGDTMYEALKYIRTKVEYANQLYRVESNISIRTEASTDKVKKYLHNQETAFYRKFTAKKELWTIRDLAFTHDKSLPTKQNNSIDYESLSSILQYLVNEEQLYFIEEEHPKNRTIIKKYSLFPIEIPTTPPPDQGNTTPNNKNQESVVLNMPLIENKSLSKRTYSTNLSLKDHLKNIKDKIDVREFLKKYLDIKKGVALCPFHDDRNPSLSVTRQYYHCFSCGVHGDSLDFLINLRGLDFKDALKELEYYSNTNPIVVKEEPKIDNSASLQKQLNEIWNTAVFTSDDKLYLKKRWKLDKQQAKPVPLKISALRYHPHLQYTSIGNDKLFYPALISKIEDKFGNFIGLQRTYLSDDFTFKRDISPVRKILGRLSGGYVAIEEFTQNNRLYVGEGVESVYSAKLLLGNEGSYYAALSSTNLPDLPSRFNEIVILADNDEAGISFAERMKEKYKDKISVLFPERQYKDFNDELQNN